VAARHQQIEIPLATARVIQHDLHAVACGCGRVRQAAAPPGAGVAGTVTYGLNPQAWCVFLIAAHAIPVHRCAELIEALTGAKPSPGFVDQMIARAAAAVAVANKPIRALIILAHVACADETPIRAGPGPKKRTRYLLVACTNLLTYHFPGDRSLQTFAAFVLPDLEGVVVAHDRCQNYDAFPGLIHQLCCAHLLGDLEDAAETYPAAHRPIQIRQALQGLIHAANAARAQGLAAVPDDTAAPLIHAFQHGVILGLGQVPKTASANSGPAGNCWNARATARTTCSASHQTCGSRPPPTRPNGTCGQPKHSTRSPVGFALSRPPGTGTRSAATYLLLYCREARHQRPNSLARRARRPPPDAANSRPPVTRGPQPNYITTKTQPDEAECLR
jgi:hypothetical protein